VRSAELRNAANYPVWAIALSFGIVRLESIERLFEMVQVRLPAYCKQLA
jgi:hypothetical protein